MNVIFSVMFSVMVQLGNGQFDRGMTPLTNLNEVFRKRIVQLPHMMSVKASLKIGYYNYTKSNLKSWPNG